MSGMGQGSKLLHLEWDKGSETSIRKKCTSIMGQYQRLESCRTQHKRTTKIVLS